MQSLYLKDHLLFDVLSRWTYWLHFEGVILIILETLQAQLSLMTW